MSVHERYPELLPYLDDTDDYTNEAVEITANDIRYVVITQRGETDSGQLIFQETEEGWQLIDADTSVDVLLRSAERSVMAEGTCAASSIGDHRAVSTAMVALVDEFSTADGPDRGNLACVWAVRHLVRDVLGRWITRTDGTAVFDPELRQCYGGTLQEEEVGEGGIIISPTERIPGSDRRNVGHVGLLGPNTGDGRRLIYSNSSSRALWKQNFTLDSWIARYRTRKQLKIRFYPLPNRGSPPIA